MTLLVNVLLLTLAWTCVQSGNQRDKLFFLEKSSGKGTETLLVVTWAESKDEITAGCEIFTDKDLINEVIKSSGDTYIRTLSEDEMENLLEDCTEFILRRRRRESEQEQPTPVSEKDIINDPAVFRRRTNRQRTSENSREENIDSHKITTTDSNAFERTTEMPRVTRRTSQKSRAELRTTKNPSQNDREENREIRKVTTANSNAIETTTESLTTTAGYDGIPVIFPGTKWCGAGDRAKSYDDLGLHQDTDRCCRAHDLCNDTLAPGETRNELKNTSPFTKLSCKCDHDFYNCLDRINSVTSNTIGNMYFNVLKRECYNKDFPTTSKCKKYRTFLKLKCLEYEKDTKGKKVYQWVPAKRYKKIPFPGPLTITLPF